MIYLENEQLSVRIAPKSAEVQRLFGKTTGLEYMWNGQADIWPRHSPLLFPFIGRMAEDRYLLDGQSWPMTSHGFVRDAVFEVLETSATQARLVYTDNAETRKKYPFAFRLEVAYALEGDTLKTTWTVTNTGDSAMPFSIGAHPGFSTQLLPDDKFEDYQLEFARSEALVATEWNAKETLLTRSQKDYGTQASFALAHHYFDDAIALVFEGIASPVTLRSKVHGHGIRYEFPDFPWFTVWSPPGKNADFVCLEPWFGIPDYDDGPFEARDKAGVNWVEPGESFTAQQGWTVL